MDNTSLLNLKIDRSNQKFKKKKKSAPTIIKYLPHLCTLHRAVIATDRRLVPSSTEKAIANGSKRCTKLINWSFWEWKSQPPDSLHWVPCKTMSHFGWFGLGWVACWSLVFCLFERSAPLAPGGGFDKLEVRNWTAAEMFGGSSAIWIRDFAHVWVFHDFHVICFGLKNIKK